MVWNTGDHPDVPLHSHGIFLDLCLDLHQDVSGNWLVTHNIYFKPESSRELLDRLSFHPPQMFAAILTSQLKRYRRRCSYVVDYDAAVDSLFYILATRRHYSIYFLEQIRRRVETDAVKGKKLEDQPKLIPIIMPWDTRMLAVARALQSEYHQFYQEMPILQTLKFPKRLTITWKLRKSLKRLIV